MKKIFFALALLALVGLAISAPTARAQTKAGPIIPLEGLDPVLLAQGKEVQGKEKISVTRDQFQYLFASEESKALFEQDPKRYEIQLGGTCARMGPAVAGNPDIYMVYQGHIYIFGQPACLEAFKAAPENYLESAAPKTAATAEAVKKGQALIEKTVGAMGGAAKLESLTSYQHQGAAVQQRQQGQVEVKTAVIVLFPDRFRLEQTFPNFGTVTTVTVPGQAFVTFPRGERSLLEAQRAELERRHKRDVLTILRARMGAGFKATAVGAGKAGDTVVEQVAVDLDGVTTTLGIDPATGRILSLSYRGRSTSTGIIGTVVQTFSDFRTVQGLTLPFKTNGTFNGEPDPSQSFTIESIALNGKIDPALFEKPKPGGAQ